MTRDNDAVSVERFINAPPEEIFELLTAPHRHHEFDGSGTVRSAKNGPCRLELGSRFGMSMRVGVPYSMVSTVIEYQENRRIAWQTHGPSVIGKFVAGRIWRYELEPSGSGTLVRETWDISTESALTRPLVRGSANATRRNMARTLARIEQIVSRRI